MISTCNDITPPEFIKKQIAECQKCKHASAKKVWCCKFGVPIIEKGKILTPDRKIRYPKLQTMAGSFVKDTGKYIASGFKTRTKEEQQKCIDICKKCEFFVPETKVGPRCTKCGCCMSLKKRWSTSHCKLGKW